MTFQLVYASRAIRAPSLVRQDVQDACERNNPRDGLSGLLLSDGVRYLQALEGEEAPVRACYDRIYADNRHDRLDLVRACAVPDRQFGDFAMAYRSTQDWDDAPSFTEMVRQHVGLVSDAHLLALFIGFAALAERG